MQQAQGAGLLAQHVAAAAVALDQHLGVERRLSQLSDNEVSSSRQRFTC